MTRKSLYHPKHLRNFNEIFRKNVYFNNVKSYKKVGLYLLCREYNFEKTTRGQNDSLLTAFLGLKDELLVVGKHRYRHRPQVSRQMPRVGLKWMGRCSLSWKCLSNAHLSVHHLPSDSPRKLSMKRNFLLPNHWPLSYPRTNEHY